MEFGTPELSSYFLEGLSTVHSPDFEGLSLTYEVERRLTWPTIGRALRLVVNKIR